MYDIQEILKREMKEGMKVQVSSKEDSWITPKYIIDKVKSVYSRHGHELELDPASSEQANLFVGAKRIYTKEDDSLNLSWETNNFFLNPPYGKVGNKSQAGIFCKKAIEEFESGNIKFGGIILLHCRIGYSWTQPLVDNLPSIILKERLRFINPNTLKSGAQSKTCQILHLVGDFYLEGFMEEFSYIGNVIYNSAVSGYLASYEK